MVQALPDYSQPAASRGTFLAPVIVMPRRGTGPAPPALPWTAVMALTVATLGLFGMIWACVQANFIKKISPHHNGRNLLALALSLVLAYFSLLGVVAAMTPQDGFLNGYDMRMLMPVVTLLTAFVLCILWIAAILEMRHGLLDYYNSVEPIGLRLNTFMTIFLSVCFFQYHLRRIAQWKRTTYLSSQ